MAADRAFLAALATELMNRGQSLKLSRRENSLFCLSGCRA